MVKTPHFHCRGWGFHPGLKNRDPVCCVVWAKKIKRGLSIFLPSVLIWRLEGRPARESRAWDSVTEWPLKEGQGVFSWKTVKPGASWGCVTGALGYFQGTADRCRNNIIIKAVLGTELTAFLVSSHLILQEAPHSDLLSPFYRLGNWGLKSPNPKSSVTQLISGAVGPQPHLIWLDPAFPLAPCMGVALLLVARTWLTGRSGKKTGWSSF